VIAGLRQRVSTFEGQIRAREFLERSPEWLQDYKPPHVFEMMKLMKAHIDVEIAFARDLADRLEAGDTLGGEFPIAPDPTQAPEPKTN
jgi:hypothetical protein